MALNAFKPVVNVILKFTYMKKFSYVVNFFNSDISLRGYPVTLTCFNINHDKN